MEHGNNDFIKPMLYHGGIIKRFQFLVNLNYLVNI